MTGPHFPYESGDQPLSGQNPPGAGPPAYPPAPALPAPPALQGPPPPPAAPQAGGPFAQADAVPPLWGGQPQVPGWGATPPPVAEHGRGIAGKIWPKVATGLAVLLIVCAAGVVKAAANGWLDSDNTAYPKSSHPSGVSATSAGEATAAGSFAGTPAAAYPQGEAGITLPEAAASGVFTAKQVGNALTSVKKALIAGRLDSQMLVSRDPDAFLKLFSPAAEKDLRDDFASQEFSVYATQFAPGVEAADEAPRVKGRVTYTVTTSDGVPVIEVTTNFVWVYAFQVSGTEAGDNLVIVHDELVWQVPQASKVTESSRGLWLHTGQVYASNMDCDQFDKGLIAPGGQGVQAAPGGGENEDSMFDPERALDAGSTC